MDELHDLSTLAIYYSDNLHTKCFHSKCYHTIVTCITTTDIITNVISLTDITPNVTDKYDESLTSAGKPTVYVIATAIITLGSDDGQCVILNVTVGALLVGSCWDGI